VNHAGEPVHLIGFSWGGGDRAAFGGHGAAVLASLTVVEPEAYSLLRTEPVQAYAEIAGLRDRWREHVRADRWYEALEEFVDFYNGPGSFARWPADRREAFLDDQRGRGDLWEVLFEAPLTAEALTTVTVPVHVVEGSATSAVDHAICDVVLRRVPQVEHSIIEVAGHMMPLTHAPELTRILVPAVAKASRSSAGQH
jgi:lipase